MRDILKLHSGTPSGTGVSLSKNADFSDFETRGQRVDLKKMIQFVEEKLIVS
jgi:hypothetical protein